MKPAPISAREAPANTVTLLTSRSAAKSIVASCVLSPSSATNTAVYSPEMLCF
jgi:hypothetical protein